MKLPVEITFDPYAVWLKIPASRRPPSFYDLLGLPAFETNETLIRHQALERLAHVRKFQIGVRAEAALTVIGELSQAFDTLTDASRRAAYDHQLRLGGTWSDHQAGQGTLADVPPVVASVVEEPQDQTSTVFTKPAVAPRPSAGSSPRLPVARHLLREALVTAELVPEPQSASRPSASLGGYVSLQPPKPLLPAWLSGPLGTLWNEYRLVTFVGLAAAACVLMLPIMISRSGRNPVAQNNPPSGLPASRDLGQPLITPEKPPLNEDALLTPEFDPGTIDANTEVSVVPVATPPDTGTSPATANPTSSNPVTANTQPTSASNPDPPPGEVSPAPNSSGPVTGTRPTPPPSGNDPTQLPAMPPPAQVSKVGLAGYLPEQATGPPDTLEYGDVPTAWASASSDGSSEWLLLEFSLAVWPARVRVFESCNPGAVHKISVISDDGREQTVWEGRDPAINRQASDPVNPVDFDIASNLPVRYLKLWIDSANVTGWNEIDAVQLIAKDGFSQWAVAASASSTFATSDPRQRADWDSRLAQVRQQMDRIESQMGGPGMGGPPMSPRPGMPPTSIGPSRAPSQPELEQAYRLARCNNRYRMLLAQVLATADLAQHGPLSELGLQPAGNLAGTNVPEGYRVYAAPYYYVWQSQGPKSTEPGGWSPEQALGPQDSLQAGDQRTAWASATPDGQAEWLMVEYDQVVSLRQIEIYESYNPGAVSSVTLFTLDGQSQQLVNDARTIAANSRFDFKLNSSGLAVTTVNIGRTNGQTPRICRVRIDLDSERVQGYNEIDAVALRDTNNRVHWAAAATASSSYGVTARELGPAKGAVGEVEQQLSELEAKMRTLWQRVPSGMHSMARSVLSRRVEQMPPHLAANLTERRLVRLECLTFGPQPPPHSSPSGSGSGAADFPSRGPRPPGPAGSNPRTSPFQR